MDEPHWNEPNWVEIQSASQAAYRSDLKKAMKSGLAEKIFFGAALQARQTVLTDYSARIDADGGHYRIRQGLDASIHTREDVIAVMNMTLPALKILIAIKRTAWAATALLTYIAVKVS